MKAFLILFMLALLVLPMIAAVRRLRRLPRGQGRTRGGR